MTNENRIQLVENANEKMNRLLREKSTTAYYKSLCDDIRRGYETVFATDFQTYVQRIGGCVQQCVIGKRMRYNTYLGAVDFLCGDILHNKTCQKLMRAVDVNDEANKGKHTIKNVNVDIGEVLNIYNHMIDVLVKETSLSALKICKLGVKSDIRDKAIFEDKKSVKYGQVDNVKFQLMLSPQYKADPYTKRVETLLTIIWPEAHKDFFFVISVTNKMNNKQIIAPKEINLSKPGNRKVKLSLSESALDRRVLSLEVSIQLKKEKEQSYTTGILFWKKNHSYLEKEDVAQTAVTISQLLRNESN